MARPRPNSGEPAGPQEPGYGGSGSGSSAMGSTTSPAAPYPPMDNQSAAETYPQAETYPPAQAVPFPPPHAQSSASTHQTPVVDGTPVSFPPAGHAVTRQRVNMGGASPYPQHIGDPWSSGLFACDMNETNAVMTAFFPCVTFGQIAEILDEGQTSCTLGSFMYILMVPALLSCWILGSNYRQKLRQKYNLVEAPYEDWAVHLFCPCCALCQEFRELEKRGFDPSLGWMGHLANQQAAQTTPPMNQYMSS